jgi:hypothetical protein
MKKLLAILALALTVPVLTLATGSVVDGGPKSASALNPNLIINKATIPATNMNFFFEVSGPDNGCDGTVGVTRLAPEELECDPGVYFVTEQVTPGWVLISISCEIAGGADAQINIAARRVRLDLSAGSASCTFTNAIADPIPAFIQIQGTSQVGLQSVSLYEVDVFGITGAPIADGVKVNVSTNFGQVTPVEDLTAGGGIFFNFIAPPAHGQAVLTVTAGNVSAQKVVQVGLGGPGPGGSAGCLPLVQQMCVVVACGTGPGGTATVTFFWQSLNGEIVQFLDLSLFDNAFAPGTFLASGPLAPSTSSFTWTGILPGLTHYWRVNALFQSGTWFPTNTGFFTPC